MWGRGDSKNSLNSFFQGLAVKEKRQIGSGKRDIKSGDVY